MKNLSRAVVFLSLFFIISVAQAANPLDVVVNELAWMGTNISANDEWIELYNNTESPINLDGWQLVAQDGTPKINPSGTIPAHGFYLLERTDDTTVPNIPADQVYTGALGNSGETLELFDNLGDLIDKVDNSNGWLAGDNNTKQTIERKPDDNWQASQNPGGTPKAQNSILVETSQPESTVKPTVEDSLTQPQQPIAYPPGIVINEVLPSPEGPDVGEEWIEIFNQNDFEADLSSWQITDTTGKTNTYVFPLGTKISAQGFLALSRPTTKITLNNDGDGLLLIQPNGNILDSANYQKAPRGQSCNRTKNGWVWSSVLTPGGENILTQPEIKKEVEKKSETEAQKLKASPGTESQLASVGEPIRQAQGKQIYKPLFIFLIAFGLAIFSGAIILTLKKKLKKGYNKEI